MILRILVDPYVAAGIRVQARPCAIKIVIVQVEDIRSTFTDRGVIRLDQAFSPEIAARMRDVVWRYAERKAGVKPDDQTTWPLDWLPWSWKSLRRNRIFDAVIDNPLVPPALDTIFSATGWQRPKPGAQVLLNLPKPGPWTMDDGWHMDTGFERPTWPTYAVKLFAFFGEVVPCGGGTMLLPGSHRLVDRYRSKFESPPAAGKANWHSFLRRYAPLDQLLSSAKLRDFGRSMIGERYQIEGIPIDVVELTGKPGDVVITHLHVFHCPSPNTSRTPRHMLAKAVLAA